MTPRLRRLLVLSLVPSSMAVIVAARPATGVDIVATAEGETAAACGFSIRASNNISHDVWLYFYDSTVTTWGLGVLSPTRQLKIQNVRIPAGKTMKPVNYSANGGCDRTRDWRFKFKRGTQVMDMASIRTKGDNTQNRTIDLGPASRWERAD